MFINNPREASKFKHAVYLIASAILGILINYLMLVAIQVILLQWILHSEKNIIFYSGYPPFLILICVFLIMGAIGGFFIGRYWWRIIYVEQRYKQYISTKFFKKS